MLVGIISRPSSITSQIPPCTPELWPLNCPKLGFTLSKSKSFHPVFIKHGENVGGHNILTKFYDQPIPPGTPDLWPLELSKIRVSVLKSFHPVFIKLGEYVGGHYISTKSYNLPNPPGTPELWPLNCPISELAVSALQVEYPAPKNIVITMEFTTNTAGVFCVSLALLFSFRVFAHCYFSCLFSLSRTK